MNQNAELHQASLARLTETFSSNLLFLQKNHPKLYQRFKDYQPQSSTLAFDHNNQLNILITTAGQQQWLYSDASEEYAAHQIHGFLQNPRLLMTNAGTFAELENPKSPLERCHKDIANLASKQESLPAEDQSIKPQSTNMCKPYFPIAVSLGLGLGQHISILINKANIDHLIIYESNPDFFYASLFSLNLSEVVSQFFKIKGKSIQFIVEESFDALFQELTAFQHPHQAHYLAKITLLSHLKTPEFQRIANKLEQRYTSLVMHTGFIEDEITSFEHTTKKIQQQLQFLQLNQPTNITTAIIIANGPSLDQSIELIAQYQHHCVLFSCSSSLQLCLDKGIQPDFHVECERGEFNLTRLESIKQKQQLKRTHLLSLNPSHTDIAKLFGDATYAFKDHDIGTHFLNAQAKDQYQPKREFSTLHYANPTSGNCALNFALELNIKTIILVGFDCGYADPKKHHSKDSIYFKQPEIHSYPSATKNTHLTIKNVNGDLIQTDPLLIRSKQVLEKALENYPASHCINTGLGAKIQNTQWKNPQELEKILQNVAIESPTKPTISIHRNPFEKDSLHHLNTGMRKQSNFLKILIETLNKAIPNLEKMGNEPETRKRAMMEALENLFKDSNTLTSNNRPFAILCAGSMKTFSTAIATQILASNQAGNHRFFMLEAQKIVAQFFSKTKKELDKTITNNEIPIN